MRLTLVATVLVACVAVSAQTATVRIGGAVPHQLTLTADDIASMPHQSVTVAGRDQSDRYSSVPVIELLKRAGAPSGEAIRGAELTKYILVTGADGYPPFLRWPNWISHSRIGP